jgi:hypothetical protein
MSYLEATRQDKVKQTWGVKIDRKRNYRVANAFDYGLFVTNYTPKYFQITLMASDIILLIFSNNF